jgi:hypothetical protein
MLLQLAYFSAICVGVAIIPTYVFSQMTKNRFLRAYQDAALLQTSRLDGWDTSKPTSKAMREEYRRWLVDCHKASYIPICMAGSDNFLTVEPAAVLPTHRDTDRSAGNRFLLSRQSPQRGAVFRRNGGGIDSGDDDFFAESKSLLDSSKIV